MTVGCNYKKTGAVMLNLFQDHKKLREFYNVGSSKLQFSNFLFLIVLLKVVNSIYCS
jgi:hypothetical protein